jgi:hypothetical protein
MHLAGERDGGGKAETHDLGFERLTTRAVPDEHEMRRGPLGVDGRERIDEGGVILHRNQTRDAANQHGIGRNSPCPAHLGSRFLRDRREGLVVGEVGDRPDATGRKMIAGLHRSRDFRAVGEHGARQAKRRGVAKAKLPIGQRMPPSPARDHDGSSGDRCPHRREDVAVHVVRMNDLHLLGTEIPQEPQALGDHRRTVQAAQVERDDGDADGAIAVAQRTIGTDADDPQIEASAIEPFGRADGVQLGTAEPHVVDDEDDRDPTSRRCRASGPPTARLDFNGCHDALTRRTAVFG